jgi:putative two-component system response regulator
MQTVLIVDDMAENIDVLRGVLFADYRIRVALGGAKALEIAMSSDPPDLILLDVQMPGLSGFEVCRQIKKDASTRGIPVIFVTSMDEPADEALGFEVGGVDYVTKPISPMTVLARVRTHLALASQNRELEQKVVERTVELSKTQDVAIYGLSVLAEYRDDETGAHILRTKEYVHLLAKSLMLDPRYKGVLDRQTVELLHKSSPLHDIGKVGVPDSILLKKGRLTRGEFEIMKRHAEYGSEVIRKAEVALKVEEGLSFLRIAREITISHHEKWDGSGYPHSLAGEAIPLSGRIMAVADVFDALISKRVYKPALPYDEVMAIMAEGRGSHFDPWIFDVFRGISGEFRRVSDELREAG